MTFKRKIVRKITSLPYIICDVVSDIIRPLMYFLKNKKLHKVYVYFRCYDFVSSVDPATKTLCFVLGLKKELETYREENKKYFEKYFKDLENDK